MFKAAAASVALVAVNADCWSEVENALANNLWLLQLNNPEKRDQQEKMAQRCENGGDAFKTSLETALEVCKTEVDTEVGSIAAPLLEQLSESFCDKSKSKDTYCFPSLVAISPLDQLASSVPFQEIEYDAVLGDDFRVEVACAADTCTQKIFERILKVARNSNKAGQAFEANGGSAAVGSILQALERACGVDKQCNDEIETLFLDDGSVDKNVACKDNGRLTPCAKKFFSVKGLLKTDKEYAENVCASNSEVEVPVGRATVKIKHVLNSFFKANQGQLKKWLTGDLAFLLEILVSEIDLTMEFLDEELVISVFVSGYGMDANKLENRLAVLKQRFEQKQGVLPLLDTFIPDEALDAIFVEAQNLVSNDASLQAVVEAFGGNGDEGSENGSALAFPSLAVLSAIAVFNLY